MGLEQPVAVLLGDVVRSREVPDRQALHERLLAALGSVSDRTTPLEPLRMTVGDEFQGRYARLGEALTAAFLIRMALLPDVDTRFGIGWGTVALLDAQIQDGPAWWSARDAIDSVARRAAKGAMRHARTEYRSADPSAPSPDAVNAALLCRDQIMGLWDARACRLMQALLRGQTQQDFAAAEGITISSASHRFSRDGLGVARTATDWLGRLP